MSVRIVANQSNPKEMALQLPDGSVQKFSLKNKIVSSLYDTVAVSGATGPGTAITAGTQFEFFQNIQNKLLLDTNMGTSRKLLSGSKLLVQQIGIYLPQSRGNLAVRIDDVQKVVDGGYLEVWQNDILVTRGPLTEYPIGMGMYGSSTRTDTDIFSLGIPSTAAMKNLQVPVLLTSAHDIQARLTFFARTWDAVGAGGAFAMAMPTITGAVHVRLVLKGILVQ